MKIIFVFVSLQNPIEPSINDLDSLNDALDSRINTYNPIYQHVEMSNHDVNSVPKTHSYQPKNPLYDSEYATVQNIPSIFPEDSYDYKYLGLPLNKYLTQPSTTESDIPINLVAIRKTSVFGYGFPSFKSPYSSDSVWNLGSKYPNTIFGDSQSVETDPGTVSSPTVRIVRLFPETLQQDPIAMPKSYPNYSLLLKLLSGNLNEVKNSVKDETIYEITQETPTEDVSDSITSEETQTENQSNILVLEENLTENESNSITTEETLTIPMSTLYPNNFSLLLKLLRENPKEMKNSAEGESIYEITQETPTEDDSDTITFKEIETEDRSNILVLEENLTEDESNSITTEETQTEENSNTLVYEENPTKNIFDFITIEENLTGDESNSITTEETPAEEEFNSRVFDSITTEETQAKYDESKSTTSQETTTDYKQNYAFGKNWYLDSDEDIKIKELFKEYEKFITDHNMKPQFYTPVDNIPAKSQSNNLLSDEDTNQKFQPQLANGVDAYDEYNK